MQYKKIEGMAYNLHLIKTDKFKNVMVKINFKNKITKSDIINRRLISDILLESNSIYNTRRLLGIKTEDLYNLNISENVTLSGNVIVTSFTITFLNDKYAEEGLLNDAIKFLCDVIFKPKVDDEKFDSKALELAKKRSREDIESIKENPREYTIEKVYEIMGKNTPLSYSTYGTLEELEQVDAHNLYLSYLSMLKNDNIDIFVIGDINYDNVTKVFKEQFDINTKKREQYSHYVEHDKIRSRFITKKESRENNQSILILGYKLNKLTDYERQYVLPIYSYILGGGPDSRLFKNVREKNSICYSISSQIRVVSNIMLISAGINAKDYNKAVKLIKKEVQNMSSGEFDESDIEKAKLTYLTAYKEVNDSMWSIISDYINHEYLNTDLIEVKEKEIMKVTKKDIMNVISKIHPDLVFFLEGTKNNEEDTTC